MTAHAEVKTVPVTLGAVGTVEAISSVDVRAQVGGQVEQILFTPGSDVRKGQPLFALDRRPLEAALRQAEAVVAKDQAQATDADAQRRRAENLFKRGLIPREQYETQTATAAALEATLGADRAQLDQARLNLQYASITSPLAGRTGALQVHAGDLVRTADTNPLVTINQVSPIYVSFSVPARFLLDIQQHATKGPLKVSASAQAALPADGAAAAASPPGKENAADQQSPIRPHAEPQGEGRLTFIDNAVDAATATINLKATFPNRDRSLWPGLFVQVSLELSLQPNAVVIPALAVQTAQHGQYVYVVKPDQTVEVRTVALDRQQGDEAIIANGLAGGEEVVTEGQLRLTPGAKVTAARPPETGS